MRQRNDLSPRPAPAEDSPAYPLTTTGSAAEAFDPSRIGQLLLFRWRLIAGVTLLVLLATGVYLWRAPRFYAARATVQVEGEPRRVTNFDEVSAEDLRPAEALKTLEAVLTARPLLRSVAEANHLANQPGFSERKPGSPPPTLDELADVLGHRVSVGLRRGTRLIDLTVEDRDPNLARQLAESLLAEFATQRLGESAGVSQLAQQVLTRQAEELRAKLEGSERELQNYREKTRAVSLEEGQNIIAGKLRDLNTKVTEAKSRRVELESSVTQVQAVLNKQSGRGKDVTAALVEVPAISTTPEVADLRRQLNEREADLAVIEKRYLYKHPKNVWAKNQIAQLRAALDRAANKAAEVVQNAYRGARETEVSLENALQEQEGAAMDLNRVAGPYQVLQRQAQSDRALYDSVLTRLKQTDVLAGIQPGMGKTGIRVVEPPVASSRPVKPARLRTALLALVAGLGLGVFAAVARELFNASFRAVDDAEKALNLPGLAVVPEAGRRDGRRRGASARELPMVHTPGGAQAEAFRSLRASLGLLKEADGRSVLFTSALPGEGKTFCAANYAVSLAQQGLTTLFISADLRRPRADALLGQPEAGSSPAVGLTDCLEDQVPLARGVRPTDVRNLSLLPAGRPVPNPAELLAGDNFARLLASALTVFDRVVVDTPPVQAVSDALLVARHVGAVCLVVHAHEAPRRAVQRACDVLERAGVTPVGFVFNRLPTGAGTRYRRYAYGDRYVPAAASDR